MKTAVLSLSIIWFMIVLLNSSKFSLLLFFFIIFAAGERFWETFINSKQNIFNDNSKFDWLFRIIALSYILMMFGVILEYIIAPKRINYGLTIFGIIIFALALVLRLYSIKSLGGKLKTFILGRYRRRSLRRKKIIKRGAYKYIRHPIYLGGIIESISIPLIFNAYYTLVFVCLTCVPFLILRAYLEEREIIKIFGENYIEYKSTVPAFFPWRALRGNIIKKP